MIRNVIFIFLLAAVLIFVFQNMQTVEVKFLLWSITISRALMLLVTLAIGLIGGGLLTYPTRRRKGGTKK